MGMGHNGGPPMPLPPTEVEEPYRLSQLGTQPLLVPVSGHYSTSVGMRYAVDL